MMETHLPIRFRKELAMYNLFSTYFLEGYARDYHAELLAEAEKARLVKQAWAHLAPRQTSRAKEVQFKLRSGLTVLASYISQTLSDLTFSAKYWI